MKARTILFGIMFVTCITALFASAQEKPAAGGARSDLISIILEDVDLQDIIRMMNRIANVDITADPKILEGKRATLNAMDQPWKQVLESALTPNGLTLIQKGPGKYEVVKLKPGK